MNPKALAIVMVATVTAIMLLVALSLAHHTLHGG